MALKSLCNKQGILGIALLSTFLFAGAQNLAKNAKASASSCMMGEIDHLNDGIVSNASHWVPDKSTPTAWMELTFDTPVDIGTVVIYTGYKTRYLLDNFDLSFQVGQNWITPEEGKGRKNIFTQINVFLQDQLASVQKVRVAFKTLDLQSIREIAVYEQRNHKGQEGVRMDDGVPIVARDEHQIGQNQVGYLRSQPKQFTAPLSPDGSKFIIRRQGSKKTLFRGSIKNNKGNFSDFKPVNGSNHFVIDVKGGNLKGKTSHPFLISEDLYEEQYWQSALDFLIDTRSVIGTHASAYGGCPWRDGNYYDAIVPSLVLFYAANPELHENMPRQIDWEAEKEKVMAPNFQLTKREKADQGVIFSARQYFRFAPPKDDAPDVVKLIHWGAGFYLVNPATRDPSRDPLGRRIHSQTVEQVSYVLWAWPLLKQWLPQSFYDRCYDFCFNNWDDSLGIDPLWSPSTYISVEEMKTGNQKKIHRHPYKGRHAPGHSIVPNLIMHEVAKKTDRDDATMYLKAAVSQAQWVVDSLDWKDPRTTKGHRMSEHRTLPNLVWLLQKYPEHAPEGLQEKIEQWVDIAITRSENYWDFRRFNMDEHWTVPSMNEVGNTLGLPAIGMSVSWVIKNEKTKKRLREISYAAIDQVFGRNPRLTSALAHPELGMPEIETDWPRHFGKDRCARLELCRGSISSLPGSEMYPFAPEAVFRHEEGWVNYGAAWCISLAYLKWDVSNKTTPTKIKS